MVQNAYAVYSPEAGQVIAVMTDVDVAQHPWPGCTIVPLDIDQYNAAASNEALHAYIEAISRHLKL